MREAWELAAFVATAIGLPIAALGLCLVALQTYLQKKQTRRDALIALYAELDTHEARNARAYIYNAPPEDLRLVNLKNKPDKLRIVDETLAKLERMAYPIVQGYLPSEDAYNLYGGVLLAVSERLWPYIEDQRKMREAHAVGNKLIYRRYLEAAIRKWANKYPRDTQARSLKMCNQSTSQLLKELFPKVHGAEQIAPADQAKASPLPVR